MAHPIVSADLVAVTASGQRIPLAIHVAFPVREPTSEWSCHIRLDGLYDDMPAMRGEDSLQALCLALGSAASLLQHFIEAGGRLECVGGGEFPFEAYFGGLRESVQSRR